jgi:hypothetical protein
VLRKLKLLSVFVVALMLILAPASVTWAQDEPAQNSYEGEGFHFISGESFPTDIQVAGYDQKNRTYYLNYTLHTTKVVNPGSTATFNYVIEVFDDNGATIGSLGSFEEPQQVVGEDGSTDAVVENSDITIDEPGLPAAYRVVVTITDTQVN